MANVTSLVQNTGMEAAAGLASGSLIEYLLSTAPMGSEAGAAISGGVTCVGQLFLSVFAVQEFGSLASRMALSPAPGDTGRGAGIALLIALLVSQPSLVVRLNNLRLNIVMSLSGKGSSADGAPAPRYDGKKPPKAFHTGPDDTTPDSLPAGYSEDMYNRGDAD